VRITPQFAEDWAGFVGDLFRGGIKRIDEYNVSVRATQVSFWRRPNLQG